MMFHGSRKTLTQTRRQARLNQRIKAVMGEPSWVAGEHISEVWHAIFEHRQSVDAHAEGEALIFIGVEPATA